jgi:hypothetical protein
VRASFNPADFRDHPFGLVNALGEALAAGGAIRLTAASLASQAFASEGQAATLLKAVAESGHLESQATHHCPECGELLTDEEARDEVCPQCHEAFGDHGGVRTEVVYAADRPPRRLVQWIVVLHGMNTPGRWQEALQWHIAKSYGRMVPVAIYKYGIVRPGVLFRRRHQQLVTDLVARLASFRPERRNSLISCGLREIRGCHFLGSCARIWSLNH